MHLSVIVPTFRKGPRLGLTLRCLTTTIEEELDRRAEVIVVDDGGGQAEDVVRALRTPARIRVVNTEHRGRSAARNAGATIADGDRLLFLDDDVLTEPGTLTRHLAARDPAVVVRGRIRHLPWLAAFHDPVTGMLSSTSARSLGASSQLALGSRVLQLDDGGRLTSAARRRSRTTPFERDIQRILGMRGSLCSGRWIAVTGAQVSLSASAFAAVGGFDERMGMRWGAEDLELGYRCELAGLAVEDTDDAVVYHMDHERGDRDGDHAAALSYFASKHARPGVLRLLDYFVGQCALEEVIAA